LNNIATLKSALEVIQTGTIRKLGCGFLLCFHGSILHHLRDKAKYWSKIVILFILLCIRRPYNGGPRWNIAIPLGTEKPEWWGYSTVKKIRGYV